MDVFTNEIATEPRPIDPLHHNTIWDISQNVDMGSAKNKPGIVGCVTPGGWLFHPTMGRTLTGGENVPAALVERALLASPRVAQAAVFGLPDVSLGERVVAAVVAHAPPTAELQGQLWAELPQLMRQAGLAQYMRPRQLVLCHAMPLRAAGLVRFWRGSSRSRRPPLR